MNKLFDDPEKTADELFARHDQQMKEGMTLFKTAAKVGIALWLVGLLLSLTVLGVIGFVAYHFISKIW